MSFFKAVQKIMPESRTTVISGLLEKYIVNREDNYGVDEHFHPSSMYYMCPRLEVLKRVIPPELMGPVKHDVVTRAKFDIGHAVHAWYQNVYLGPMGILKGRWFCRACGFVHGSSSEPVFMPKTCGKTLEDGSLCDGSAFEYIECAVISEEWNIVGKTDGIITVDGTDYVVDIKTIDPDLFKKLSSPWPSNTFQIQIYMWLFGIKKGILLYVDKSSNGPSPVREFLIEHSSKTVNDACGRITSFNMAMQTRSLPVCMCPEKGRFSDTCSDVEKSVEVLKAVDSWRKGCA